MRAIMISMLLAFVYGCAGSLFDPNDLDGRPQVAPQFMPVSGTYSRPEIVTIIANTNAVIYYTVDGSAPTRSSAQYSGPFGVTASQTVRAFAVREDLDDSRVSSASYVILHSTLQPNAPVMDPAAGTMDDEFTVSLTSASTNVTIYYTTDGSEPTALSSVYLAPISVTTSPMTVKSLAMFAAPWTSDVPSYTTTNSYTIVLPKPEMMPSAGAYSIGQAVSMSSTVPLSTIRYTINGADPTGASPAYAGPVVIGAATGTYTVRARTFKGTLPASDVITNVYSLYPQQPVGCWRFFEGSGGMAADGVFVNNASVALNNASAWSAMGKSGNCLWFDGDSNNSIVNLPGLSANILTTNSPQGFSISCWVKWDAVVFTPSFRRALVMARDGATVLEFYINTSSRYYATLWSWSSAASMGVQSAVSATVGGWDHVVLTFSPDLRLRLYVNNVLSGTSGAFAVYIPYTTSGWITIGNSGVYSGFNVFNGSIDEVTIYTVPLSAAEIASLYTAGM